MTKPVTSVAIMMLLDRASSSSTIPVSKYLPGYDKLQVITKFNEADGTYETRPAKTVMTIRHLLTHTSGIGYGFTNPIENAAEAEPERVGAAAAARPGDKVELRRQHARARHDRREGQRHDARGLVPGAHLQAARHARHVVRGAADKQSRVPPIQPLHRQGQEQPARRSRPTPAAPFRGDGGLYSTVEDYWRFMRMLLNGGKLGSAKILSENR